MALRKDKVASALQAMKGICSDPDNPTALPEVMGQLANILGDVFDDIALPDPPQLDSGEFGLPEDAPFDFPLGGGDMPFFDPLEGFEGGFPGGGGEFGPGGDGPDQVWIKGDPCPAETKETRHVTLLAKAEGEIPAAENGNPGEGTAKLLEVVTRNEGEFNQCENDCRSLHEQDLKDAQNLLNNVRFAVRGRDFVDGFGDLGETRSEAERSVRAKIASIEQLISVCINDCFFDPNPEGPQEANCRPVKVKNISCEKIESGTQIVVSGTATYLVRREENGQFCEEGCPYDEDLYVIVESCGCCDE